MALPLDTSYPPMEARSVADLPDSDGWQYEPKWDGFRCLAFRDGEAVDLRSKSGQPLGRYFPDVVAALTATTARRFVLDGELLVPVEGVPSFEHTQMRLHPAASRVRRLAAEHPARYEVFDLLVTPAGEDITGRSLGERRAALEAGWPGFEAPALRLSPTTGDAARARRWLAEGADGCDGVMAKRLDMPYRAGLREGMVKVKRARTADCVVGGFRTLARGGGVGSLLLGLYDAAGLLHHVGFTASITAADRPGLTRRLQPLQGPPGSTTPGFTGRAPGGPSRWSHGEAHAYVPLRPELVVEVGYDHVSDGRFRHGTRLLRFRPDKAPGQCRMEQLEG